jgi:TRAP-type C4-dicarboxylate transport system permease small subunit
MILVRFTDWLTKILMIIGAIWAFCLCFVALTDIVLRSTNIPISGTKEIVANSVVIIVFMQVGYAVRSGSMLRADFLVMMFPPWVQKVLSAFAMILGAVFFLYLLNAAVEPAMRSFRRGEFDGAGALQVPVWPARWAIVIGAGLAGFNYILLSIVEIFGLRLLHVDI